MLFRPPVSVLFLVLPAFAQAPPGYYSSVDSSSAASLRLTLHQLIDDHTRIPYTASQTDTWDVLNQADEDPQNSSHIIDVYRNDSYQKISGGVGAYNREHTWPKSYGFPDYNSHNYPYTDCHQLYLCDGGYNSSRSNRPFASTSTFATERTTLSTNGAGGGSGVYPGNSNWYDSITQNGRWEVWGDRRGDVARALFYLDIRYEGGMHGITGSQEPNLILTDNINLVVQSNTGNNEQVAYMGYLSALLQWHDADPVDQRDLDRNDVVFSYQGNPNPFVDHPEWVDCLFANQCSSPPAPALAQPFGTGCGGTGGQVPALSAVGLPTSGNPAFGVQIANSISFAPWLTGLAGTSTTTALNANCTLYLQDPISYILGFTNVGGQDTLHLPIPAAASFLGFELFFQAAVFDSNGSLPPGIALSNALSTRIGS